MDNSKPKTDEKVPEREYFTCKCGRETNGEFEGRYCSLCGTEIRRVSVEEYRMIHRLKFIRENAVYGALGNYRLKENGEYEKIDI